MKHFAPTRFAPPTLISHAQWVASATLMIFALSAESPVHAEDLPIDSEADAITEEIPPLDALPESVPPIAETPSTETPSVLDDLPASEEATTVAAEPQPTEEEPRENEAAPAPVSRSKRSRHPRYQFQRPAWGGMITYAPEGLGGAPGLEGLSGEKLRALQFSYEWQPRWIQAIGVIGLGPKLSAYPILPESDVLSGPTSIWSYGFRAHYQARFFREQPIVPFVAMSYEKLTYELVSGLKGTATLSGLSYGGMILLNWLEPRAAAEAFSSSGILRTYFVAEVSKATGTYSTGGAPSGDTLSFGLRLEH